jgi:thiol-disulfide isomerase/thioredoxin
MRRIAFVWLLLIVGGVGCGKPKGLAPEKVELITATAQDVMRAIRQSDAKVVLVNMWATWCAPCREEFPDIVRLHKSYRSKGLKVVFVSWDANPEDARRYLAEQGVDFPSFIKTSGETDPEFIDAIEPRWTGAFPATMIYDGSGKLHEFWEGKASYATFEEKVRRILNQSAG